MHTPIRFSIPELEAMLLDTESDLVERKESLRGDAPTKVREAICAFANDLPGHGRPGVVFVGARDRDGGPSGLDISDELLLQLADMRNDGNLLPPPMLTVSREILRGHPVAVVTVQPSDSPPVKFKGRTWIRVGPSLRVASAQEERRLNERRRHLDVPFDLHPIPTGRIADLNLRFFEESYLPGAVAPDVLEANERTAVQRLAALKMIAAADEPVPTVTGMLVLGIRPRDFLPGAYVQFLRVDGEGHGDDVSDELVADGSIVDTLRKLEEKLDSHNRVAVEFVSGERETRRSPYPRAALQQLVRNAVMHRTYEATNAPVHVYWFDDRIEIHSPGGPFGVVTRENFGEPGITDYRNPNLAESMRVLGFVQRFDFGIPTARRLLQENGNPALQLEATESRVLCKVGAAR